MPLDSLLLSIAVCSVFLIFAAVLVWVDRYTSAAPRRSEPADKADMKKAA
jgi:hypothetical protein